MDDVGLHWPVDLICVILILPLHLLSPGVIITDVHKRAGLDEEQYSQVTQRKRKTNPLAASL